LRTGRSHAASAAPDKRAYLDTSARETASAASANPQKNRR